MEGSVVPCSFCGRRFELDFESSLFPLECVTDEETQCCFACVNCSVMNMRRCRECNHGVCRMCNSGSKKVICNLCK